MKAWRLVALALLVATACGSRAGSGGTELNGRTYLSIAVTENGAPRPLVTGTRIRLTFDQDGRRIAANAGCNHLGGQARIDAGRLVVTDLATTDMGCDRPRHDQDEWLGKLLLASPSITLTGTELVLATPTAELRLQDREVADPDRPLVGTKWVVDTLIDKDVASSIPQGAAAHLTLAADGSLAGSPGCNTMGGSFTSTATTMRFSGIFTTKMACEDGRMRVEQAVLDVLRDEVTYEIEANVLRLHHASGRGLQLRAE
jgi:heat shock protein HslJ